MLDGILGEIIKIAIGLIGAVIVPVLSAAAVQALRKLNFEVSAENQAKIERITGDILLEVEEWASRRLKANLPAESEDKLQRALSKVLVRVPGLSEEDALNLIHETLPKIGLGATATLERIADSVRKL